MVGGGSLSLPYAFSQAGIGVGLFILVCVAICADFTVYASVACSRRSERDRNTPESFEEVARYAFGERGKKLTMFLVFLTTYIAVMAYAILLRDLASPLAERLFNGGDEFTMVEQNICMIILVLLVTPLMFLKNMTSLKPVAMVSMTTITALTVCIAIRSYQCNFGDENDNDTNDPTAIFNVVGEAEDLDGVIIPPRSQNWYVASCSNTRRGNHTAFNCVHALR